MARRLKLAILTCITLSTAGVAAGPAGGSLDQKVKRAVVSGLPKSWQLRDFTVVGADPKPWRTFFSGDAYVGYAALCMNPSETVQDSRSKGSSDAGAAARHPQFYLWLFHSEGLTLTQAQKELDKNSPPYRQTEAPELIGESKQFVAACLGDCLPEAVLPILRKLKISPPHD
jgi:hypothetical protein